MQESHRMNKYMKPHLSRMTGRRYSLKWPTVKLRAGSQPFQALLRKRKAHWQAIPLSLITVLWTVECLNSDNVCIYTYIQIYIYMNELT